MKLGETNEDDEDKRNAKGSWRIYHSLEQTGWRIKAGHYDGGCRSNDTGRNERKNPHKTTFTVLPMMLELAFYILGHCQIAHLGAAYNHNFDQRIWLSRKSVGPVGWLSFAPASRALLPSNIFGLYIRTSFWSFACLGRRVLPRPTAATASLEERT